VVGADVVQFVLGRADVVRVNWSGRMWSGDVWSSAGWY
jgi:hypothetical protein